MKLDTITLQKQADQALRENRQKFHDIVKYLEEGYVSVTADGFAGAHYRLDDLSSINVQPLFLTTLPILI